MPKDQEDNFIADACILMAQGMTTEEVNRLVDQAAGLIYAAALSEKANGK